MSLPVLFDGYMILQDIGNDAPAAYRSPVLEARNFQQAYSSFIKPTEDAARGIIGRDHVNYLSDLDDSALAKLETWEPAAFVMKVSVDYRGDIRILNDGTTITREDIYLDANVPVPEALLESVPEKVGHDADIKSDDVRFAIVYLQHRLGPDARQLFTAVVDRALSGSDPNYTASFTKWLGPEGGTVVLRDELCLLFKPRFDDRKVEGRQNNVWFDAWCGIDSAKLAYREEFRVGSLSAAATGDLEETYSGPRM
jgi:hypothetical protein